MMLIIKNSEKVICDRLEVADTFFKRFWGLMLKPCPKDGEGIIFYNCNAIHMFFMRYPIDVLFLDINGSILKIVDNLKPWKISSCTKSATVIELAPGFCTKIGIKLGDKVELVESK